MMERRDELHRLGCSIAKQTILTSHPSGLCTRVSVELASVDTVCLHHVECQGSPMKLRKEWDVSSPFLGRRLGGLSAHGTPVLGRRSDIVTEGRLSQQCTPVMRRKDLVDSPASSPVPSRRFDYDDGDEEHCVDNCVISGWLKFRDNKRWKSRWGVVTKLSPAADCVHLQLYGEARERRRRGHCKASLSLQQFLGFESGFTLDKESHTIGIICQDVVVVLAFETRERLISWQVKVGGQLGTPRQFLVMVGGGGGGGRKLPAGPARLHLHGAKFAITSGVPPRLLGVWQLPHLRRYGVVEGRFCFEGGSHCGKGEGLYVLLSDQAQEISEAFWRAAQGTNTPQRRDTSSRKSAGAGRPDTRLSDFNMEPQSGDSDSALYEEGFTMHDDASDDDVTLDRCTHCSGSAAEGALPTNFTPAWTMEGGHATWECLSAQPLRRAPPRPPKPTTTTATTNAMSGPYENYDVPKPVAHEVDNYYDTPKRIREAMADANGSLVFKKNCGCVLKLGAQKKPHVLDNEDWQPGECACQRVTNWASNLIRLPYCKRDDKDGEQCALYATVDVSTKSNRQSVDKGRPPPENVPPTEAPCANYENLHFATSLEYYENAKHLLKKAGVTQRELDALSDKPHVDTQAHVCATCSHSPHTHNSDQYLLMAPPSATHTPDRQNAAYIPMSPMPRWTHSLKYPTKSHNEIEKSLSIAALNDEAAPRIQKRSNSVDSARLVQDFKELNGSSAHSPSSETLRNAPVDRGSPYEECCNWCDPKTESSAESKETPRLRNKLIDNALTERIAIAPCNRDSSSSNDSGVSSYSLRHVAHEFADYEMAPRYVRARAAGAVAAGGRITPAVHCAAPRKSKSSELRGALASTPTPNKSSSAEAEVPLLSGRRMRGVVDSRSTSSGTSDMSDYIETLSLSSEHSSTDASNTMHRIVRESTSTLRPRSGNEYTHTSTHPYKHLM